MAITTKYKYDEAGRTTEVTRESQLIMPDAPVVLLSKSRSVYEKTSTGRTETQYDTKGMGSRSYYDHGGRLTMTEQLGAQGAVMSQSAYEYDKLGRKKAELNKGVRSETEYNDLVWTNINSFPYDCA